MYNLRSSKRDTVQFPIQIQVTDDEQFLKDLLNQNSLASNTSANMSDSMHESSDSDIDCDALIDHSDEEFQSTSTANAQGSNQQSSDQFNLDLQVQSVINSQILEQL